MRIWIDLTNSPHVLVFRPLVQCLCAAGHEVEITARDFAQTVELCRSFGMPHSEIGRHRGGRMASKAVGLTSRSWALYRWARGREFDLALAHGSNDISVAARALGIRSVTMFDYEFATVQHAINCRLAERVVVPERIPPERLYRHGARGKLARYPGLKEEYYLADFEPSPAVLERLDLDPERVLVVVRTPPEVSLYHRFRNELFGAVLERVADEGVQAVVLPRTPQQRRELAALAPRGGASLRIPSEAIDAQSLIWFADLVIGAGGTMNREAVALGTPVYTTFAGRLGAVDGSLIDEGRLQVLRDPGDLRLEKKPAQAERVRRDPQRLVELLL